jgi:hypothetical protein
MTYMPSVHDASIVTTHLRQPEICPTPPRQWPRRVAQPAINSIWHELDYAERLEFIRTNLAEIWTLVEHITNPQAIPAVPSPESDEAEYQRWLNEQDEHWLDEQES